MSDLMLAYNSTTKKYESLKQTSGALHVTNQAGTALIGYIKENYKTGEYSIPLLQIGAWSAFTNQPADDGVEAISNSASDVGNLTILYTAQGAPTVLLKETKALNGVTAISFTSTHFGNVLGAYMGDADGQNIVPAVGIITIREASGDAAITTIAAGNKSTGLVAFDITAKNVVVINKSGQIWFSTTSKIPTISNVASMGALDVLPRYVTTRIALISNVTGGTCELMVEVD